VYGVEDEARGEEAVYRCRAVSQTRSASGQTETGCMRKAKKRLGGLCTWVSMYPIWSWVIFRSINHILHTSGCTYSDLICFSSSVFSSRWMLMTVFKSRCRCSRLWSMHLMSRRKLRSTLRLAHSSSLYTASVRPFQRCHSAVMRYWRTHPQRLLLRAPPRRT